MSTISPYVGDGSTRQYGITFSYRNDDTIKARVNGTVVPSVLLSPSLVELDTAPASGALVEVFRETPVEEPEKVFSDGQIIRGQDLNIAAGQSRERAEELGSEVDQLRRRAPLLPAGDVMQELPSMTALEGKVLGARDGKFVPIDNAPASAEGSALRAEAANALAQEAREVTEEARDVTVEARAVAVAARDDALGAGGQVRKATWPELSGTAGSDGQIGVSLAASGSHPSLAGDVGASGGQTPNGGEFRYTSAVGWVRLGAVGSLLAQAWAESATAPNPADPASKSAKVWAETAAAEVASIPFEDIPVETGTAFGVVDIDGYVSFDVENDGTFAPSLFRAPTGSIGEAAFSPTALARLLPSGFGGEWFTFPTESGHGFVITDLDDYIAFGTENSGDLTGIVEEGTGGEPAVKLHDVVVYGDSMSDGNVPWLNPGEDWPSILRSKGRTVINRAIAGQTAGQIIARQMGSPCLITVSGNQIPASGSVAITVKSELFVKNFGSQAAQSITGILCGVPGTILRDAAGNTDSYTFVRTTPGIAIPCPAASPFVTDTGSADQEATQVIWVGRNGVASIMTTTIAKVEEAIRYLDHGRFLIIGVTTLFDGTEDIGSTNWNLITSYNNYMAARWGSRFFDVRRYLIDQALADAGITPTSQDLADIAADRIPIRFKEAGAGIIHLNALANSLVEAKIEAILTAKEF